MSTRISKARRAHLIRLCSPRFPFESTDFQVDVFLGGVQLPTIRATYDCVVEPPTRRGTYTIDIRPIVLHFTSSSIVNCIEEEFCLVPRATR